MFNTIIKEENIIEYETLNTNNIHNSLYKYTVIIS